jgi:multisubunit Na+/H+ antiporter MnhE subunit
MEAFVQTGLLADFLLVVLVLEGAWLVLARRRTLAGTAAALLPGACLVLALRFALTGAPWWWTAAAVAASLPFHLWDLRRRPLERRRRL